MQKAFHHCNFIKRPAKVILSALPAVVLLLSGCGDSSEALGRDAVDPAPGTDKLYFSSTEKVISNPKEAFEANPENQGKNISPV